MSTADRVLCASQLGIAGMCAWGAVLSLAAGQMLPALVQGTLGALNGFLGWSKL